MEKNITVEELVNGMQGLDTEEKILEYLGEKIQIEPYVSYLNKLTQATTIVKLANFKVDDTGYPISYNANSALQYAWEQITIVNLYTNIEIHNETALDEYDILSANGILAYLRGVLPEDVNLYSYLVQRVQDDLEKNWNEPHAFLDREFKTIAISIQKTLEPAITALGKKIEKTDIKDIEGTVTRIIDRFNK